MANVITDSSNFDNIANAIRNKNQTTETYKPSEMAAAVLALNGDANATEADILAPKIAYGKEGKLVGTIPIRTESEITESLGIITIPLGYYAQQYQKQGDPSGDCNATDADILLGATAYASKQLRTGTIPKTAAAIITPSTNDLTLTAGLYLEGNLTIKAVSLLADASKILDTETVKIRSNDTDVTSVTGTIPTKTASALTHSANVVTAESGYYATDVSHTIPGVQLDPEHAINLSLVFVSGTGYNVTATVHIPAGYYDDLTKSLTVTGLIPPPGTEGESVNIQAGYTFYNAEGLSVVGTMPLITATTYTPTTSDIIITANLYLEGAQTISGDTNLVAENIAQGTSIFGVNGNYTNDADATSEEILLNKTAYIKGSKVDGTMPNNGVVTGTITAQNGTYTIPTGFTSGGTITAHIPTYTTLN